jgi:hypothetical protein
MKNNVRIGPGLTLGAGLGIAAGAALHYPGLGIAVGAAFGLLTGALINSRKQLPN